MKKRGKKLLKRAFALMLALIMAVPAVDYSAVFTVEAEGVGISVKGSGGYEEGAYVEWEPVTGADGYLVYVSQDVSSWPDDPIDDELIRSYGTYYRADVLGLTAGEWYVKIEAVTLDSDKQVTKTVDTKTETVTVTSHDRTGYAWVGYEGTSENNANENTPGAYKKDGSLKDNAQVIYVTNANKNTVSLDVTGVGTCVGLQRILDGYKNGQETKPLDVRIIGNVTDLVYMNSGDIVVENGNNNAAGITIEGVGEDAVANGWGIRLSNASNVEIRNLGFMNCDSTEGDNVGLQQNNYHIWVHNCDFFYGEAGSDDDQKKGDGMLDCKQSSWITFSYNHFWDSGKSCLLGLVEGDQFEGYITYHHNWFDHSDSRHPRVRYYTVHVYNNYYDGNAKYGIGAAEGGASIFAENNYFRNCKYPMLISQQGSDVLEGSGNFESATTEGEMEAGSIIKAYNNYIEGAKSFIAYASSVSNDEDVSLSEETIVSDESAGFIAYVSIDEDDNIYVLEDSDDGEEELSDIDGTEDLDADGEIASDKKDIEGLDKDVEQNMDKDLSDTLDKVQTEDLDADEEEISDEEKNIEPDDVAAVLLSEEETDNMTAEVNAVELSSLDTTKDFDAYVVENRTDNVPNSVVTKKGGNTYSNFDTEGTFYNCTPDPVESVPSIVKDKAGRINGGDFEYTFDNAVDDESSKLNTALKEQCVSYTSSLVSVGGIQGASTICYFTVTVDPGIGENNIYTIQVEEGKTIPKDKITDPSDPPANKVCFDGWYKEGSYFWWDFDNNIVTDNMTLIGKWLAEGEQGGSYGPTAIGDTMVIHDFTQDGTASPYFAITGELYDNRGTSATYVHNDTSYQYIGYGLTMNTNVNITFTTTTAAKLVLLLSVGSTKSHYVDGKRYTSVSGIIEANIGEGEHSITGYNTSSYLFAIMVLPGEGVVEEPSNKIELLVSDIANADYLESFDEGEFTITANSSNKVTVSSSSKTINDVKYTSRLRMNGAGAPEYRSIKFKTTDAATLYIACASGSTSTSHKVGVATLNEQGAFYEYSGNIEVDGEPMSYDAAESSINSDGHYISLRLPKADTYYVYGKTGDVAFYYISVTYDSIVTFESNGGSTVDSQTVEDGKTCTKPADPTKEGYTFAGWYKNAALTEEYDFSTPVTANITLYAKWTDGGSGNPATSYTVTFNSNGGTEVESQTVENGQSCTKPTDPTKDGYTFAGWYTDDACTDELEYDFNTSVTANITLYAKWVDSSTTPSDTVSTPYADPDPNAGNVAKGDKIKLFCNTDGASIYYNINEEDAPSVDSGKLYDESIADTGIEITEDSIVDNHVIIKAIAVKQGLTNSAVGIFEYEVSSDDDGDDDDHKNEKGLVIEFKDGKNSYPYTGSAIKPEINVRNNGKNLTLGVDYTVKYTNNINVSEGAAASKQPKVTVTGKGSLSGSTYANFTITKKNIDDDDVFAGRLLVVKGKKISAPSIYYGSAKLTTKNFSYDKNKTFSSVGPNTLEVTGAGNFTGSTTINVEVVENAAALKAAALKFTVAFDSSKADLTYTGDSLEDEIRKCITVTSKSAVPTGVEFEEEKAYLISFPQNLTDAGTVKFTVVGIGEYSGCNITKSCKILPKTVTTSDIVINDGSKQPESGKLLISGTENSISYSSTGATFENLSLSYSVNGEGEPYEMKEGRDYKVTYSGNKKVSSSAAAKYTISFMGNYKGKYASPTKFTITKAELNEETASVELLDKSCTGKEGVYTSTAYVSIGDVALKSSEYKVTYYTDAERTKEMSKTNKLTFADGADYATVYIKITASEKNYTTTAGKELKSEYKVWKTVKDKDLAKAKVTFYNESGSKITAVDYTGEAVEPAEIRVTIGSTVLKSTDTDPKFTYEVVNNKNKGKATVVIKANTDSGYVGGKTATFKVASRSLKDLIWGKL